VVLNGKDPLANLGSNTDTELIWQTAVFELSVESGEPMIAIETQVNLFAVFGCDAS